MKVNNLGFLNKLGYIINESDSSVDYVIAKRILENIDKLETLTVNSLMEDSYVSRSTIRRFCRKIGFENFSDLQNSVTDIMFPSNIHLRDFFDSDEYRKRLKEELKLMIEDINNLVNDDTIIELVELIRNHNDVILISANNTSSNLLKFQQELFYAKKIVRLVSTNYDDSSVVEKINEDTLIFVVSVSGVFSREINENLRTMNGKKLLMTANRNEESNNLYDKIIYISKNDIKEDKIGLLGKYGITYIFDMISQLYIYRYH